MSESRWNDAGTRPLVGDAPGTKASQRTRSTRVPAGQGLPPAAPRPPRWGALPFGRGIVLVVSCAAIGTVATILLGREPGFVLGFFLIVGTFAASFAVRAGAVYRILPVPALAYLGGAIVAGLIHDRAADTSHTALVINAAQWSASGFVAMVTATVVVAVVGAARFLRQWRRYGGVGPRSPFGPPGAASPSRQATPPGRVSSRGPGERSGHGYSAGGRRGTASATGPLSSRSSVMSRGPARPHSSGEGGSRRQGSPPGSDY